MDPAAALGAAFSALKSGDTDEAREYLETYREWRANGGFQPAWTQWAHGNVGLNGDELATVLYAALAVGQL